MDVPPNLPGVSPTRVPQEDTELWLIHDQGVDEPFGNLILGSGWTPSRDDVGEALHSPCMEVPLPGPPGSRSPLLLPPYHLLPWGLGPKASLKVSEWI